MDEQQLIRICLQRKTDELANLLADLRIDPNYEHGFIITPLYYTCEFQWIDGLKLLLNNERVEVNKANNNGKTPFYIACEKGCIEVVMLMLDDERVDVNKAEGNGRTPFYIACKNGQIDVVKLLLNDARIYVDLEEKFDGKTVIEITREKESTDIARTQDYDEVIELLESFQRNPVETKTELKEQLEIWFDHIELSASCREGKTEKIKQLLMKAEINPNWHNHQGFSPLYVACQNGHIEVVKLLLNDQRIDINLEIIGSDYIESRTPLQTACEKGLTEIVKLLIKDPRIDINKANHYGETPFWIACQGRIEIVKLLLNDPRVDVSKENKSNSSPFYIACVFGCLDILEYIFASDREIDFNRRDGDGLSTIEKVIRDRDEERQSWENNVDFDFRRELFSSVIELIQRFEKNPDKTRFQLRKKIGLLDTEAASIYAMIVLISDHYYLIEE